MTRRLISTGSPMENAYGYSRAVAQDPWVFVSGTTGYDYATMTMPDDVAAQARNCWSTIEAALRDAGSSLREVVRATYYVTDTSYAVPVLEICGETMGDIRPAASIVVVAGLLKPEMKVEIEVTALKRSS
jgi:enamine deaminase RidA (YjgF/YER057c/UK114 family)